MPSLSWTQIVLACGLYWVLLMGGWLFHTTRPSTQARARARALTHQTLDPETGMMQLRFETRIRTRPIALLVLGPPLALVLIRLILV